MRLTSKIKHTGIVRDGKFIPDDAKFFKWDVSQFEGLRCSFSAEREKRTDRANRYYFLCVGVFVRFFNQEKIFGRVVDTDFVHELIKVKFLGTSKFQVGGEILEIPNSSRNLDVTDFNDLTRFAKQWGEELFSLEFPEKTEQ